MERSDSDKFLGGAHRLANCDAAYILKLVGNNDGVRVIAKCVKDRFGDGVGSEYTVHEFLDSEHVIYGIED